MYVEPTHRLLQLLVPVLVRVLEKKVTVAMGSIVVPFCGLYLESYKVIPQEGTTEEPMGRALAG